MKTRQEPTHSGYGAQTTAHEVIGRRLDGVKEFLRKLTETQEVVEFRPEQFIAQRNQVIVLGRFVMRVKSTGRESASHWAHAWTITAGTITHYREYVDTAAVTSAHRATPSLSRQTTLSL